MPDDQPPPPTDWHCSLLDIPAVWEHDVDSIPAACPYLPPRVRQTPVLPPARQFRVAIVWAGNATQKQNRRRSCRLEDFAPLFELPGTEFVSFQVGPPARELRAGWRGLVHDPGDALDGLEATADALMEVDLVITVDTMLAHLAGALGRPSGPAGVRPGHALDARPRRHALVPDDAPVPAAGAQRLGRRLREVRRELEAHLARAGAPAGMREQQREGRSPARRRALAR